MPFGQKVRKPSKVRTLSVDSRHLLDHFHAFLLAGGLITRGNIVVESNLPKIVLLTFEKDLTEDG
jgi:hypothetical protein